MEQCIYCRQNTYTRSTNYCTSCGKPKCSFSEAIVVYGKSWGDRCFARFALTDKFLIIKKESKLKKGVTASFGIVGALVASTADPSKGSPLGYYSLSEIKHIIWPYNNKKLRGKECMKIVNHDGSDLILKGELTCPMFYDVTARFKECNIPIIDGRNQNYGDTFCEKPFVNEDTLGCRVSPAAAEIVCMMKENFVVPAIAVPAGVSAAEPQIVQAEEAAEAVKTPEPPAPVAEAVKAPEPPAPVAEAVKAPEPAPEPVKEQTGGTKDYKFCFECGNKLLKTDKFCVGCGARQR